MLPYLSGERTPHNDPSATGVFFGLDGESSRVDLGRAALEGVAFALADGLDALEARGGAIGALSVIGGGSRSRFWGASSPRRSTARSSTIAAARSDRRSARHVSRASRPVRRALPTPAQLPPIDAVLEPDPAVQAALAPRRALFRRLYGDLKRASTPLRLDGSTDRA